MVQETLQIEDLIKQISLFHGLDDYQLSDLIDRLEMMFLEPDELLFSEDDPGESMYIVFRGAVKVFRGQGESAETLAILQAGDYFGEEAMLYHRPRSASVVASDQTTLLRISSELYAALMRENPNFGPRLQATAESHQLSRTVDFDWLHPGEVVHLLTRKHPALLWLALAGPVIIGLFSGPIFFLAYLSQTMTPLLFGIIVLIVAILWGIWNAVDWGNDYYIVTNQRVVWLERVIGLYESRQEAPLRTILSVSMETDPFGRILGYGDVIVRTYTGMIIMRNVGRPKQLAALIEQYWLRTRKQSEKAESDEMVRTLREHLGLPAAEESEAGEEEEPRRIRYVPEERPSMFRLIMANYIMMRYEEGSIITYRKHWFLLLKNVWQPLLGLAGAVLAMAARLWGYLDFLSVNTVLVAGTASLLAFGAWLLYLFIDWRNDMYQLTTDHIVDIDRKPLGSEEKKSAPLENILSLRHERLGILGLVLNFGTVSARIGRAEFTFDGVHDPARVQQDIFTRMDERQNQKKQAESARERARMAEWLAAYYRNVSEFRSEEERLREEEPPQEI